MVRRPLVLFSIALAAAIAPALAQQDPKTAAAEKPPVFDSKFLQDPANIKVGETVWTGQCRHCHGSSAYPGKAPKLRPGALDPVFIYERVTDGFQKMPAWKEVFSQHERMSVVAYIKSGDFSP